MSMKVRKESTARMETRVEGLEEADSPAPERRYHCISKRMRQTEEEAMAAYPHPIGPDDVVFIVQRTSVRDGMEVSWPRDPDETPRHFHKNRPFDCPDDDWVPQSECT